MVDVELTSIEVDNVNDVENNFFATFEDNGDANGGQVGVIDEPAPEEVDEDETNGIDDNAIPIGDVRNEVDKKL